MVYMASPTELSLDCKPHSFSMIQNQNPLADQRQKLQDFIARLEEERLKIEAFKRELPLCMQLLNNAMEVYRRQLEAYQTSQGCRPVLEEFIPLKNMSIGESTEKPSAEKASWMMSAQLWSSAVATDASRQEAAALPADNKVPVKEAAENSFNPSSKQRSGAFHPFSKEESCRDILPPPPSATGVVMPELALASVDKEMEEKCSEIERGDQRRESCSKSSGGDRQQGKGVGGGVSGDGVPLTTAQRKARRCWSPDLHRRFVNALQILGGSQVATPKQIRELMKVDGLTNDEVKSHLQKYRLHTRRPMPVQAAAAAAQQPHLLVLGGIWVPPEYAASAAAVAAASGPTVYGSHPSPAHYAPRPPVPQEYYAATPQPFMSASVQLNGHLPPLLHGGSGAAAAHYIGRQASPESEVRSGEGRSESIEEEEEVVMMEEEKVALGGGKAEDGKAVHKF